MQIPPCPACGSQHTEVHQPRYWACMIHCRTCGLQLVGESTHLIAFHDMRFRLIEDWGAGRFQGWCVGHAVLPRTVLIGGRSYDVATTLPIDKLPSCCEETRRFWGRKGIVAECTTQVGGVCLYFWEYDTGEFSEPMPSLPHRDNFARRLFHAFSKPRR